MRKIPEPFLYIYNGFETETFDEETWNELNDDENPYELDYESTEYDFDEN